LQSVNQQAMRIEKTTAATAGGNSFNTISVLEQLLRQSIRLRDLHVNARWQILGSQFTEIRKMLNDHHKEQLSLIDLLVDRIRILGGAARVFTSDFLQRTTSGHLSKSGIEHWPSTSPGSKSSNGAARTRFSPGNPIAGAFNAPVPSALQFWSAELTVRCTVSKFNFFRAIRTSDTETAAARFPQLLRMKVATSATS